jgi:hypothetical protein
MEDVQGDLVLDVPQGDDRRLLQRGELDINIGLVCLIFSIIPIGLGDRVWVPLSLLTSHLGDDLFAEAPQKESLAKVDGM